MHENRRKETEKRRVRKIDKNGGERKRKNNCDFVVIFHNEWYPIKTDEAKRENTIRVDLLLGWEMGARVLTRWVCDCMETPRTTVTDTK